MHISQVNTRTCSFDIHEISCVVNCCTYIARMIAVAPALYKCQIYSIDVRDYHLQYPETHSQANTNLLRDSHLNIPYDRPGK